MRRALSSLVALGMASTMTPAPAMAEVALSGWVRNYSGVRLESPHDYTLLENTFQANLDYKGDQGALRVEPYFYQSPIASEQIGLRQAYIDLFFDSADLRIGKQQIIWGKADGVFIADVVSPKDLSQFLLRPFEEIRMGITALKADYYLGDHTLEVVIIPAFTSVKMPAEGSIWRPSLDLPMNLQPQIEPTEAVPARLENSEAFAKFSAITALVDFEIMGGYFWDDEPTLHTDVQPGVVPTIKPSHHRLALGGVSFSTTIEGWIVRGEGAYYHGKYFTTTELSPGDHTVEKDYLHYLVGVDKTLFDVKLSVQFIQEAVLDHEARLSQDATTNTLTFLAHLDLLRETLKLDFFAYVGLDDGDALLRPKVTYEIGDALQAVVGLDLFVGDTHGQFGQFGDNNMAYTKVRYTF